MYKYPKPCLSGPDAETAKPETGVPAPEEDGFINGISPKQVYQHLKKMAS
jgi:hypothetical protein